MAAAAPLCCAVLAVLCLMAEGDFAGAALLCSSGGWLPASSPRPACKRGPRLGRGAGPTAFCPSPVHQLCCLPRPRAAAGEDERVRVRFVDFAHTFQLERGRQQRDHNFLAGLRAIIARLSAVMRQETADTLA